MQRNFFKSSLIPVFVFIISCWYVFLSVCQYFYVRPLWNDEHAVFMSISAFSSYDMFHLPLLKWQVFPRMYLYFIQQFSSLFNFNLLSLRFLPFVSMMGAFFLWLKISKYEFKDNIGRLAFVLSWPGSALLIYYASELKQYSMDLLATSIFLVFLYNQNNILNSLFTGANKQSENIKSCGISSGQYYFILILLPALALLSYPASLFIVFPLYNMVLFAVKNKNSKIVKYIVIYMVSSLFFLSILYFFDVRLPSLSSEMKVVTKGFSDYFISFHSAGDFLKTLGEGTNNLFSRWFAERPRVLRKIAIFFVSFGLIEMFYGFFSQIKKEKYFMRSVEAIALILYLELFILGALRRYPFTVPRTALFFCPFGLF